MHALLLLASAALANTTSTGLFWPGASPIAANHGEAGGYVAPAFGTGTTAAGAVGGRVVYAPTDRVAFQVDAALAGSTDAPHPGLAAGARYLLVNSEHFRFAATAEAAGLDVAGELYTGAMAGLAVEAGGHGVWFDASTPWVAVTSGQGQVTAYGVYPLITSELGLNVRINEHYWLRFGTASIFLVISYAYEADFYYLRADLTGLVGVDIPVLKLGAGTRF